jgi:hypothetical protein
LKYYLAKFEILGPVMSGHLPDFSRGKSEPDAVVAGVPPAIRLVLQPARLPLQDVGMRPTKFLNKPSASAGAPSGRAYQDVPLICDRRRQH